MPTMSVTAKPLTGPVPYCARMRPEMKHGDVAVDDRRERLVVAGFDRRAHAPARAQLFADALVDEHVRVDGHADREREAGDAGKVIVAQNDARIAICRTQVEEHGDVRDDAASSGSRRS